MTSLVRTICGYETWLFRLVDPFVNDCAFGTLRICKISAIVNIHHYHSCLYNLQSVVFRINHNLQSVVFKTNGGNGNPTRNLERQG